MMTKKRYKAIFFDAGGTLLSPYPSVGEVYAQVAGRHGILLDPETVEILFRAEYAKREALASMRGVKVKMTADLDRDEKEWWRSIVLAVSPEGIDQDLFNRFFEELYDLFARPEVWRLYPDTIEVLEALKKQGMILGIVSNWDSRLHSICEGLGLTAYFDFILASVIVGSAKPHRGIFDHALNEASVQAHEVLHVGDSVEHDWHGAKGVDMDCVIVNRTEQSLGAIHQVASLLEILSLIKGENDE